MYLALLSDLKARLGTDTSQDGLLGQALRGAGAALDRYSGRALLYLAPAEGEDGETVYFDGDVFDLLLKRFPVIGDPVVTVATDYDFEGTDALVADEDYRLDRVRGRIIRVPKGLRWPAGEQIIQVANLLGGYYDPVLTAEEAPEGVAVVPEDIQEAALLTAVDLYKRRDEPGYKVVWGSGEQSAGYAPEVKLLPVVKELMAGERR